MAKVLIIAEHDGSALNPSTAKCVSCAAAIDGAEIDLLVLAASASDIAAQAAQISSVSRVLTIERAENEKPIAVVLAPQIAAIAAGYSHVFGPSTTFGRDLMPHVAALLGVNQVSDIMSVEGSHTFQAARICGQCDCHGRSARGQHRHRDGSCCVLAGGRGWKLGGCGGN